MVEHLQKVNDQIVLGPGKTLKFFDMRPVTEEDAAKYGGLEQLHVKRKNTFFFLIFFFSRKICFQRNIFEVYWDEDGSRSFKLEEKAYDLILENGPHIAPKK